MACAKCHHEIGRDGVRALGAFYHIGCYRQVVTAQDEGVLVLHTT